MAANPEYVTNQLFTLPSAAAGVSVTPSATPWANSSYSQMSAGITGDLYIVGVVAVPGVATDFECDIASGAAASEVVLGRVAGSFASKIGSPLFIPFPIIANKVTSGTRIAVRHRQLSATTTAWTYSLVYYFSPIGGNVTTTTNVSKLLPSAAAMTSITGNTSGFANSNYAQITASTANAIILGGVVFTPGVLAEQELDIATGAAASEVVITTLKFNAQTTGGPNVYLFENPLDNIGASVRVSARTRVNSVASTASKVKLIYYDKPL